MIAAVNTIGPLSAQPVADADWDELRRAAGGDSEAFSGIVERHQGRRLRLCERMLADREEARDAVQEVFIRFHAALSTFRAEASVKTFLTRIAINRSLDILRRRKRRYLVSWDKEVSGDVESPDANPDESVIESEERLRLRRMVDRLSPRHRAVVVLRIIDGLSTKETAEVLAIPYGTVLSRLKRALTKLKEHLGDEFVAANAGQVETDPIKRDHSNEAFKSE